MKRKSRIRQRGKVGLDEDEKQDQMERKSRIRQKGKVGLDEEEKQDQMERESRIRQRGKVGLDEEEKQDQMKRKSRFRWRGKVGLDGEEKQKECITNLFLYLDFELNYIIQSVGRDEGGGIRPEIQKLEFSQGGKLINSTWDPPPLDLPGMPPAGCLPQSII